MSNQDDFHNSRPPTTAARPCHMLLRLLERLRLPTSTRHYCRMIPLSAAGWRPGLVRFWPLHLQTSSSASAPKTSAARLTRLCKEICDILLDCGTALQRNLQIPVVLMLKCFSLNLASRQSAAKCHSWRRTYSKEFSLTSSNHSFQEMIHQVKARGSGSV